LNGNNVTKTSNILQATNSNSIEEAIPKLNNKYRDKEIEILELGETSKVYITKRPTN
jgi:chromosome segregation and condensation protein ScpB